MEMNNKDCQLVLILYLITSFITISFVNTATVPISLTNTTKISTVNTLPYIQTQLDPINGTNNYRIYGGKKGKEEKLWLDGSGLGMQHVQCVRRGNCEKLNFTSCLGAKIPYEYTSLDLTISHNQAIVQDRLTKFMALRHIPKCWSVIQPFLCAVFTPKCENINGEDMVYLPSLEMCRITLEPCRILYNTSYFPEFLKCNETHFPSKCNNDVREMKFNLTGQCLEPLVPAESSTSYYPGVEGCGVRCKDPLHTDDEHRQIQKLIAWGATLCLLLNLFVVATFLIDWENASKYPALIVFYINMCFMITCLGWLAQFIPGSREDIVCRKDGTLRLAEPTAGENLSCVVIFVTVYYFSIAAMVWFVFLTYAWHLRAIGNVQDRIDKKGSYFHLVAWSLPLVLTITTLALSEVDGNSTVGICFAGYINQSIRSGLVWGPLLGVVIVGCYFIICGMIKLFRLMHFANDIKSTLASNKIHSIMVRMGLCALFSLIFILVSMICHAYEFRHSSEWMQSLKDYVICRIFSPFEEHIKCKIENRPSVSILQLHLLCLFGAGIVMSTWCWTPSSVETWKRYIRKKCGKETNEEVKMSKHKVIAHTWAKRKEFENKGRLSITLYNTHTDPVGLNFDVNDLNSPETNEISSTWANCLPQFVKRRMALTEETEATNSSSQGPYKNSLESERKSISVRHVSVESRRNSADSQVSLKIQETKVETRSRSGHHHHQSGKRSQKKRDFIAATGRKYSGRRESSTSIESQVIALKKTTFPNASHKVDLFAHSTKKHNSTKRRSANVGLDPADITEFLAKNGQLIMPFLQNQGMTTTSDEETSIASFKVQDSRLDVVLKQNLSDEDDDGKDYSPRIEEINDMENKTKKQAVYDFLFKGMKKSNDSINNRNCRNTTRSKKSKKSQAGCSSSHKKSLRRHNSSANSQKHKIPFNKKYEMDLINNSELNIHHKIGFSVADDGDNSVSDDSFSSLELGLPNIALHSSYSGISTHKPNSRNSKTSCDVGIQANAFDIATQTLHSSYDEGEFEKCIREINNKHNNQYHEVDGRDKNEAVEMDLLLGSKHKESAVILSEAEKLKMLLLPSK